MCPPRTGPTTQDLARLLPPQAAEALSAVVLDTAVEMQSKPPGRADFFETLRTKIDAAPEITGKYDFKMGTSEYQTASRR